MPTAITYPGVYIEESPCGVHTIEVVATSIAAFVGIAPQGPSNEPWSVCDYDEFVREFGGQDGANALAYAVGDFFINGGRRALIVRVFQEKGSPGRWPLEGANYQAAFEALRKTDLFNLLCLPPANPAGDLDAAILQAALKLCVDRRAFLIIDPRSDWLAAKDVLDPRKGLATLGLDGVAGRNAAVFFPRLRKTDPTCGGRTLTVVPCGAVAGLLARTDAQQGVWKAPAGTEAAVKGIQDLSLSVSASEIALLNARGINCFRNLPTYDPVLWGARTLRGNDQFADEYRIPA